MIKRLKSTIKRALLKRGFTLNKIHSNPIFNDDPFKAVQDSMEDRNPIFFDLGVNHGQTMNKMLTYFPEAIIHGFEPSKTCLELAKNNVASKNVVFNNLAMGAEEGVLPFNEYSWDALNSLLERTYTQAEIIAKYDVNVSTVDLYCQKNNIDTIDFLKSDTEGYELKVLEGAKLKLGTNKIRYVHIELFFEENFKGQGEVGEIFTYLKSFGYQLIRFYDFSYSNDGIASKADALFVNPNYKK